MKKALAGLLSALMVVAIAPMAHADPPDGEQSSPPSYEVDGGVEATTHQTGPKSQTKTSGCTSNCVAGGIEPGTAPDVQWSRTYWFDDENTDTLPMPYGSGPQVNFDAVYTMSKTTIPKADKAFGYNGNAIPAPGSGNFVIKDTITVNGTKHIQRQPVFQQQWNPDTGEVTQELVDMNEWEWLDYEYKTSIRTMQAPGLQNRRCITYGEYQLNGPYDKSHNAMVPVTEGGTMTRQPTKNGPITVFGQKVSIPSALGQTMTDPKTGTPALDPVWANCLPNQDADFDQQKTETISDLGRYEAPTTLWGAPVDWLHIGGSEADIAHVFPALVSLSKAANKYRYINGVVYVILQVNPASKMAPFASYYKVVCDNGTQANKRSAFTTVNAKSYDGWDAQPWNDAGVDYYSWDCSGGKTPPPNVVNEQSFLQCDRHDITQTATRNTLPVQGRTEYYGCERQYGGSNLRWDGDHWSWDCPGGTGGGGQWGVNVCRASSTCSRWVEEPAPAGYSKDGSVWRSNCPAGWTTDSPEQCSTTVAGNVIVDGKYAAPLESANILIDGEVADLYPSEDGAFHIPSTADPVHFSWERIRINTQDGTNILKSDKVKNTEWEFAYQLDEASSPMLTDSVTSDVNHPDQPYHGWIDTTPDEISAGEMDVARKWEPGKFYTYDRIPVSYSYKDYTFTDTTTYQPYKTHQEPYQVYIGMRPVCQWWAGYQRTFCLDQPYYETRYREVRDAPPAGCVDKNDGHYTCPSKAQDPCPTGYDDTGIKCRIVNNAPYGYHRDGNEYVSNDVKNMTGELGGLEFDAFRPWPAKADDPALSKCVINPANYGINGGSVTEIDCGDNVTDRTRAAYFRYFMSSTFDSDGWTVTPWAKVTADVLTKHTQVTGVRLNADGTLSTVSEEVENWVREPFTCPAQPVTVNIERVAS